MTENKQNNNDRTDRRPDCVTEIRMGNTVLVVSGFFKCLKRKPQLHTSQVILHDKPNSKKSS